ncbi:hypothetical protein DNTS_005775 [Danionella cerebrum]|uniref:VIT domain-containing protein n=1 Tax=Danionella cerebrum TaxID=2873325 RepID=A0A553PIW3_9TELE|nr:hypothetical protein DNTS_005775 [Danionella translucida]TRY77621.1 hypothetical protein DNTS_005775 [Danionella translucida]
MVNCGLLSEKNEPVPLKSVSVTLLVQDHVVSVSSSLQYVNEDLKHSLEAVFVFPLPAEASVFHCSARIGKNEIQAEIKDRHSAHDEYDDALASGHQAFLMEESEQSPDIFRMNLGSVPPGESATVSFSYLMELSLQADGALRFCLPGTLNPRYAPAGSDAVPEVCSASEIPYTLSLSVDVRSSARVSRLESSCTLDPLVFLNPEHTHAQVSLSAGHKFDRDVELLLYYEDPHQPCAIFEAGDATAEQGSLMADPMLMLSVYPEFPADMMLSKATGEFIFLVDRSGSMDCRMHRGSDASNRIQSARDTLLLLLKSLPMGCFFNIIGFGSDFQSFFPQSVLYDEATMEEALKRVQEMKADMGGTEILIPLKHIYSQRCLPEHPRQLFIFTDGEVCNTKDILDLVKSQSLSHRCFSFGIGEGASSALITGMAQATSGHAQFITGSDRMQPKMLGPETPALFQGQRAIIYAKLNGSAQAAESSTETGAVTINYKLMNKQVTNRIQFNLKPTEDTGLTVHRLAARTMIRSLELKERLSDFESLQKQIVKLSIQAGVSSVHTAFIAVNTSTRAPLKAPMVKMNIPAAYADCLALAPMPALASRFNGETKTEPQSDPFLQLVSLQKAAGFWIISSSFANVLAKTLDELTNHKPAQADSSLWATVLALVWLNGFEIDALIEWKFVALKAVNWIRSQNLESLPQCVSNANSLLGCQVPEEALGI